MNEYALWRSASGYFIALTFFLSVAARGQDIVLIETRTGDATTTGTYVEGGGNWANSTLKSGAPGTTSTRGGSRFATTSGASFSVVPTLGEPGGTYYVEVTHGVASSISADIVVGIGLVNASGLPGTTDGFQRTKGTNVWYRIGTMTLSSGQATATISFTHSSGSASRLYADAFRFVNTNLVCLTGPPELATVGGPLAQGQTFVNVPGISSSATKVSVYADGVLIGEKTSGVAGGENRVDTSALVKGQEITATHWNVAGVESCRPSKGILVGGGANPRIRLSLSVKQGTNATTLAGPIGADGGTPTLPLKFIAATNTFQGGFANAPVGGKVITPSTNWQTISFERGPDPLNPVDRIFSWAGNDPTHDLKYDYGILDAIALAIDDLTDTGPFVVYIDNVKNGQTMIQDFESADAGQNAVMFSLPSAAGTSSPFLLAQSPGRINPDISRVDNETADTGGNCLKLSWQFKDVAGANWVRLIPQGSGTPNPQVDFRLPISFRMLMLPQGATLPPSPPVIGAPPFSQEVFTGGTATMKVSARGTPNLAYQWRFNESPIDGATNRILTITNVSATETGNYTVVVTNLFGSTTSSVASVSLTTPVDSTVTTNLWSLLPGSRPYITTDNSQRGLAYNPVSGHLLLVSRTETPAIYVLDAETGDFLHTLSIDPAILEGTLPLNMVVVSSEGVIYAGNLVLDGNTANFRIYKWWDEDPAFPGELLWSGNPGQLADATTVAERWGDTMAVFGTGTDTRIALGGRQGTYVSIIKPWSSGVACYQVSGAAPGSFGLGLCFGANERQLWGKGAGGSAPLCLAELSEDSGSYTGSVVKTFSSGLNLTAIAFEPTLKLLAGISIEDPDNLRLYVVPPQTNTLELLDLDFWPTDNENANGTGSVCFAPERVFALDSNNGILAMALRPSCWEAHLSVVREGDSVKITWQRSGYELQSTGLFPGAGTPSWSSLGTVSPVVVPLEGTSKFFRLICQ